MANPITPLFPQASGSGGTTDPEIIEKLDDILDNTSGKGLIPGQQIQFSASHTLPAGTKMIAGITATNMPTPLAHYNNNPNQGTQSASSLATRLGIADGFICKIGNKICALGGQKAAGTTGATSNNLNWKLNQSTKAWEGLPAQAINSRPAYVVNGANAYIYGGFNVSISAGNYFPDGATQTLGAGAFAFNATSETITSKANLAIATCNATAAVVNADQNIIIGGRQAVASVLDACLYYNITANTYTAAPSLPQRLHVHSSVNSVDGNVITAGGYSETGVPNLNVYEFNVTTRVWTTWAAQIPAACNTGAMHLQADGTILLTRGASGAEIYILDPVAKTVSTSPTTMPFSAVGASFATLDNGNYLIYPNWTVYPTLHITGNYLEMINAGYIPTGSITIEVL